MPSLDTDLKRSSPSQQCRQRGLILVRKHVPASNALQERSVILRWYPRDCQLNAEIPDLREWSQG